MKYTGDDVKTFVWLEQNFEGLKLLASEISHQAIPAKTKAIMRANLILVMAEIEEQYRMVGDRIGFDVLTEIKAQDDMEQIDKKE